MEYTTLEEETSNRATPRKVFVLAPFSANSQGDSAPETRLCQMLEKGGVDIITASAEDASYADISITFRTKRLFSKTTEKVRKVVTPDLSAIVYLSGLSFGRINKPSWPSRRKEEWRRIRTIFSIAKHAGHCTVILDETAWNRALGLLLRLGNITPRTAATPADTYKRIMALHLPIKIPPVSLPPETFALRANAARISKESSKRKELSSDLVNIYDLHTRLKKCRLPYPNAVATLPDSPEIRHLESANISKGASGISQFMHHYNSLQTPPFELSCNANITAFIRWYLNAPVNKNCTVPLPVPQECLHDWWRDTDQPVAANILNLARRVTDFDFLPAKHRHYFAAPLGGEMGNISKMELLCAMQAKLRPENQSAFREPWNSDQIRQWYQQEICRTAPSMQAFSSASPIRVSHPINQSISIKGITEGASGLAANAWMSARALNIAGLNVAMKNFDQNAVSHPKRLLRSLSLHHINADQIPQQILASTHELHIGFPMWELESIPRSHHLAGHMLDEIWVPSAYLKTVYEAQYQREVVNVGKGITLPFLSGHPNFSYGITHGNYVVICCFDAHSSVERKNPLAAVTAFQEAFEGDPNARMLVKTTPTGQGHWGDPNGQMSIITQLARQDSRIIIDRRMLPIHELLKLIKAADCLISTHRAEGFGYIPAYALGYGTPVVCTDYSGTTEVCDTTTSFPVTATMISIKSGETIYPVPNGKWADVDIPKLAKTLKFVKNSPEVAAQRTKVGQKRVQTKFSLEMQAHRYEARLKNLGVIANS